MTALTDAQKRNRKAKRDGATWETDALRTLVEGGIDAERLPKAGAKDQGDIVVKDDYGIVIIECKNTARLDLAGFVKQAQVEADNYADARPSVDRRDVMPVALIKARGKSTKDSYVVTTLADFFELKGCAS